MAGGLNHYGYADGDAINRADPFGLRAAMREGSAPAVQIHGGADADNDPWFDRGALRSLVEGLFSRCAVSGYRAVGAAAMDLVSLTGVGIAGKALGRAGYAQLLASTQAMLQSTGRYWATRGMRRSAAEVQRAALTELGVAGSAVALPAAPGLEEAMRSPASSLNETLMGFVPGVSTARAVRDWNEACP